MIRKLNENRIKRNNKLTEGYETMYRDRDGLFGDDGELYSLSFFRKFWRENHEYDPVMSEYDNFEDWWDDTVGNGYVEEVEVVNQDNVKDTMKILRSWKLRFNGKEFTKFVQDSMDKASTPSLKIQTPNRNTYIIHCDTVNETCYIDNVDINVGYADAKKMDSAYHEAFLLWTVLRDCDELIFNRKYTFD